MTGALSSLRADLAAALTGAVLVDGTVLPVLDVLPQTLVPPALLIEHGEPYLTTDGSAPIRMMTVHHQVLVLTGRGTNPAQVVGLEALVEQVIDAVHAPEHDWIADQVTGPLVVTFADIGYLGARVSVSRLARITTT